MSSSADGVKRRRVYEQWQGNEKFFCWGYLVAGPNWRASLGTAFLLLAPTGIFLGFVAPYVMREVHVIIMVFSVILPMLCALWLFLTACRDPGIIPRQEPDDEYLAGRKPRTQEVMVNDQRVVIRYNDTCHFYQPPRAHHCSVNDNCIERFDHHCPWVGTTIGKRNYRTFLLFVYTSTVFCLYVIGVCLAQFFLKHKQLVTDAEAAGDFSNQWGQTAKDTIPALVLMFYTFLFLWFVGGLSGFHAYLVGSNQTTYENFRYNHDSRPNPFDRGLFNNCAEVWCTRVPASKVDFRAFVDPPSDHHPHRSEELEMGEERARQGSYTHNPITHNTAPLEPHLSISMDGQQPAAAPRQMQIEQPGTAAAPVGQPRGGSAGGAAPPPRVSFAGGAAPPPRVSSNGGVPHAPSPVQKVYSFVAKGPAAHFGAGPAMERELANSQHGMQDRPSPQQDRNAQAQP